MIVEKLRQLEKAKEDLLTLQKEWQIDLKKTYPCIETVETKQIMMNIETELEFSLSCCVKNKSGRFEIPANLGYKDCVVLTRVPGLKRPRETYTALPFKGLDSIDSEGNLHFDRTNYGGNSKKDGRMIEIDHLRNEKGIDQERFEKTRKRIHSFLAVKKRTEKLIKEDPQWSEARWSCEVGKFRLTMRSVHFSILFQDKKDKEWKHWDSEDMVDFYNKGEKWDMIPAEREKEIVEMYKDFHSLLLNFEKDKIVLVEKLNNLLKSLKIDNKSFRVLKALTAK